MPAGRSGGVSTEERSEDSLGTLAEIAGGLGAGRLRAEAISLAERVADGRFYVACVGQFKRGKSTLLNALVGEPVLPTGVVPITATPTILRYGHPPSALVRYSDGEVQATEIDGVGAYVVEEENPDNAKGVEAVEILLPSPLLRGGMCLVDTPGLGSVFEVATGSTHAFVPHIDAALLVLGADPPISADEATLAATVAGQVDHVIVVLTKADRLPEADRRQAVEFAERVLEKRMGRAVGPILEVSAQERLAQGPTRDWDRLLDTLNELSAESGRALVRNARERAVGRLGHQLQSLAAEQRSLLTAPGDDRSRRLQLLRQSGSDIEERLLYLGKMLLAEQERLAVILQARKDAFLEDALPRAFGELEQAWSEGSRVWGGAFRRRSAEAARDIGRRLVEPWLIQEEAAADELYREAAGKLVRTANSFLDDLASTGEAGVRELPHAAEPDLTLRGRRRFYFDPFPTYFVSPLPIQWILDSLSPRGWFRRRMRRKTETFLRWLLEANSTRVRSDLLERVAESRRQMESEIRSILEDARSWTEQALERAQALHAAGQEAVEPELARLDEIEASLRSLTSRE